jgi:hypothetical protein
VSKETSYSVKRDLLQCQKRPTTVSKETYYSVKKSVPSESSHQKAVAVRETLLHLFFFLENICCIITSHISWPSVFIPHARASAIRGGGGGVA